MFEKTAEESGIRLDAWLAENETALSRARWQSLILDGSVHVNGETVRKNYKVSTGDHITWSLPEPTSVETRPENIPLDILHEDSSIIVINKPSGLVVHPAVGNETGTLVNALLYHCDDLTGIGGELRPGIVHRLDKDTSGVIIIAKTEVALNELARQFKERETRKEYLAIVKGIPAPSTGRIETTIGRHPIHRKKMAANVKNGRSAISNYKVVQKLEHASLISVQIETGRTHQIRVHMAFIKHPVLGDQLYAKRHDGDPERQMLHAEKLTITHPDTGQSMTFAAPLPQDMDEVLNKAHPQQS